MASLRTVIEYLERAYSVSQKKIKLLSWKKVVLLIRCMPLPTTVLLILFVSFVAQNELV